MAEERDELERAWQALTERERLVQETVARRSAEIDARARRFDEIAADLDARRQLIEEAEDALVERERRLTLGEEELEDRRRGARSRARRSLDRTEGSGAAAVCGHAPARRQGHGARGTRKGHRCERA